LELLATVTSDAASPSRKESRGLVKAVIAAISTTVAGLVNLSTLWEKVEPLIRQHLGLGG